MIENNKLIEVVFPTIHMVEKRLDGYSYRCDNGMFVIQSFDKIKGKIWVHTSFSRRSRLPEYSDMKFVKDVFVGDDYRAIMIMPKKINHVNIHEYCLHYFTCMDDDGLPDFTLGGKTL